MYFRNYELAKTRLDKYLKSAVSQYPSTTNMVNALKQCSNYRHLYHTYWSPRMILSLKMSLLVICKMLWLFVNTFTADDKYSPLNRDNLTQPIQKQLSQNWKTFSECFSADLTSTLNFEHFQKKVDPRSQCISEITNSQRRG